jgi:hypothetical protein
MKYKRKRALAEEYDISLSTVNRRIVWILKHQDRYPAGSVIHSGTIPYIREDVFRDCMTYGNAIEAGIAPAFGRGET